MSYPDVMVHFNIRDILCTLTLLCGRVLECAFHVNICDKVCTIAVVYNSIVQV